MHSLAGRTEDYELEKSEKSSSFKEESTREESTGSGTGKEMKDYLEVINVIESLMKDENFSLENESSLNISKVLSFLNKEISEDGSLIEAWLIKGTVLYKIGKYNSAIEVFIGALEIMSKEISEENALTWQKTNSTNYRYALKFKALALFKLGRYNEASDAFNKILEVYPADSEIQKYRRILYTIEDENLIAELNIVPYNYSEGSISWEDRGLSLYELDEYEEALEEFGKGLEINPQDARIWGYKGVVLYRLGRYKEALEAFDKSLGINPKNAKIWSFKGSTLYMLDRPEEALKAFEKALQKNPNILEAWFNKGTILFKLGKYKQSLAAVENALRINTKDANALNLKSSILDKLDREESLTS